MLDRNDEVIAWVSAEKYFKTGSFKSDEPGFFESVARKFDLLAPCTSIVLLVRLFLSLGQLVLEF